MSAVKLSLKPAVLTGNCWLIGVLGLGAAYIHIWWLPRHGINGWTGEPKEKYYELIGVSPRGQDKVA